MLILLTCVFGITPDFPGEEKSTRLRIGKMRYEMIRDEEGNTEKKRICRERFGHRADLAWFELESSLKTAPELESGFLGGLVSEKREDVF